VHDLPDENAMSRYFSMLGKCGNMARNQRLSAQKRKEIATKASKAAAKETFGRGEEEEEGLRKAKKTRQK
jgi:hypothetical protein